MKKIFVITLLLILCSLSKAYAATLTLSPASLTLKPGGQQALTVALDPQGDSVIGTDIFLTYDPNYLKVISVVNLKTFPGLPSTIIQNDRGLTKFSLIHNYGIYQTQPADIATVTVEAIKSGTVALAFDFTPGKTQDTNVAINGGVDSLTAVANAAVVIEGLIATSTPTIYPSPTSNPSPTTLPTVTPHLPNPTRRPISPPGLILTSPPLAPGFVSPLSTNLPTLKPSNPPQNGRVMGTTSNPVKTSNPWGYLFLSCLIAAFILTVSYLVYLLKKPVENQNYA